MISSVLLLAAIVPPNPTQATVSTTARDLAVPAIASENRQLQAAARPFQLPTDLSTGLSTGEPSAPDLAWPDAEARTRRYTFTVSQAPPATASATTNEGEGEVVPVLGADDREQALEISADRQEFDRERNVVAAEGEVIIRFSGGIIQADRVRVNLTDRVAVATGNVVLTRGDQVLRGEEFEYSFVRDGGRITAGTGEISQPTANRDFDLSPPAEDEIGTTVARRRTPTPGSSGLDNDITNIQASGALAVRTGTQIPGNPGRIPEGEGFNRLRFQADSIVFDRNGWRGSNVRIANDPFNPPELAIRAETATFRRLDAQRDELVTTKPRLVLDGGTGIPLLRNRIVLDRRGRPPAPFNIGFDGEDRDGLFIERTFTAFEQERVRLRVTPQWFVERSIAGEGFLDNFGAIGQFSWRLAERTSLNARATLLTLAPEEEEDRRARVRLRQRVGNRFPHTIDLAYNLQERIFNGSLGFQDVTESGGLTVLSPQFEFRKAGVTLSYQADIQRIRAETNFEEFLGPDENITLVSLTRFQGAIRATWSQALWTGEALPPTPDEGLRYVPIPLVPEVRFFVASRGVFNSYSNGDTQNLLSGTVGLRGQFGRFSRRAFSYTAFLVSYTNGALSGESPFLFDRAVDTERVTVGLTQQLFGPFRFGIRSTLNVDTSEEISTDYILEYSRRTYNVAIRVNPQLEVGSLQLRINAFNWQGTAGPLEQNDIRPVTDGVAR